MIGVLQDFHLFSLQHKIEPLILKRPSSNGNKENVYVRINAINTQAALQHIADVYKQFNPTSTFDFHFLDEAYDKQYSAEKIQGRLLVSFTLIIVIISCLGLFGLISFETEKRRKEIGIRKVLGSSASGIVLLLNKIFFRLAIIAFLLAAPMICL